MFHAWPSFFFFLLKKIYGANNFTRFRRFNSCLNVRGCVSIGQEAFSLERDESTPDWTSHDRLTRNDSTHFHDRRPFRCAPPFLRSLETNTVDSEIVTKETDSFSLLLISRFPLLARFFSSSSQPFVGSNEIIAREMITLFEMPRLIQSKRSAPGISPIFPSFRDRLNPPSEGAQQGSLKRRNNNLIGLLALLPVSKLASIRN